MRWQFYRLSTIYVSYVGALVTGVKNVVVVTVLAVDVSRTDTVRTRI